MCVCYRSGAMWRSEITPLVWPPQLLYVLVKELRKRKGGGTGGLGQKGCHLMLTTDQSEGPRLSRTVEERGAGSSEADPAGQLSLARRHR